MLKRGIVLPFLFNFVVWKKTIYNYGRQRAHAKETYRRYNDYTFYSGRAGKAKLCFLNDNLKWEEASKEKLNEFSKLW